MRETIYDVTKMLFVGLFPAPFMLILFSTGVLTLRPGYEWAMLFWEWTTAVFVVNLVVMFSAVFYYALKAYKNEQKNKQAD